jgi:hypothetical protein
METICFVDGYYIIPLIHMFQVLKVYKKLLLRARCRENELDNLESPFRHPQTSKPPRISFNCIGIIQKPIFCEMSCCQLPWDFENSKPLEEDFKSTFLKRFVPSVGVDTKKGENEENHLTW